MTNFAWVASTLEMFKKAPVSFASAGQGSSVAATMSMGSLAKSLNAYDEDDGEDDGEDDAPSDLSEEAEAHETASKGRQPHDLYSRYGIGAQLMMKMGYQQGKGLGARQEGIVNPIETKMRPQGLGVGGVSERGAASEQLEPTDSSDDDDAPVHYDVYGEIQRLERLGARLPLKYKHVCDHMDTAEPLAVAEAYGQLSAYARELQDAVQEEQFVEHELQAARDEIGATERDLAASAHILAVLELHLALDPALVPSTLQKLQDPSMLDASIDLEAVFVSVVAGCVQHCGEDALAQWRQMYTPAKRLEALCQWDRLLLQQRIIPLYQAAAAEDRVDVLMSWQKRQDLLVDPELVVQELIRGTVEPQLHRAVTAWAESGDSSRRVLYVVEYLPFVAGEPLVARVHQWFVDFCDNVYTQRNPDELVLLEQFWRPLFAQYGLAEAPMTTALVSALLRAVSPDTATVATLLSLSPFIESETMLLLMQFKVFNPWLLGLNSKQPETAAKYKTWYNWWAAHRLEVDRAHMRPMVEWNLSVALAHLASGRPMVLPTIAGKDAPADAAIGSAIESIGAATAAVDAAAVPSYRLLTSFKDVVQQYCAEHDILFGATARQLHRPLYRLQRDDKSLVCYIEEDVLWIKRTDSYEPISLHELTGCF